MKKNKVVFGWKHIKSKKLLESEVIPHYPKQANDIRQFVHQIHFSVKVVIVILIVLSVVGIVMIWV